MELSNNDIVSGMRKLKDDQDFMFGKTGRIEQMMIDLRHKEVLPAIEEAEKAVKTVDKLVKESKVNKQSISNIQSAIEQAKSGANAAMARAQDLLKDINHINDKWDAHDKELLELMNNLNSLTTEQRQQATELMQKQQDLLKNVNTLNDKWTDSDRVIKEQRQRLDSWANELTNAKTNLQSLHDNLNDTSKGLSALTDQAKQQGSTLILVQQGLDGLKQSVADVKGNVTSLSQRADLLQATVTDQAKSISQVSLKADGLSSQVSTLNDKANQQAQSISQFNQTATSLQGQVASLTDASGKQAQQISEMKLDAEGVHTAVSELAETSAVNLLSDSAPDWVTQAGDGYATKTLQAFEVEPGEQYTVSVEYRNYDRGRDNSLWWVELWPWVDGKGRQSPSIGNVQVANQSGTAKGTFTVPQDVNKMTVDFAFHGGDQKGSSIEYRHVMVSKGTVAQPYTSNTYGFKDIATLDQTAKALTATVANNSGDLATLKQTATELRSDITNANGDITTLKTRATGFDALIGTKASQADLNNAKKLISDNTLSINATKNALQVKADQITVDRVKNQVDTVSAQQTIQANEIAQRVTKSELTTATNGLATQNWVQTQVKQNADQWNLNITALENRTKQSLKGAGVNLYKNTALMDDPSVWDGYQYWGELGKSAEGINSIRQHNQQYGLSQPIEVRKGETFTLSAEMIDLLPAGQTTQANFYWKENSSGDGITPYSARTITLSKQWKRYSFTFTVNEDRSNMKARFEAYQPNPGKYMAIRKIKLERGSVATPYTQAPADLATTKQVTDLKVDLNGVKSTMATQGQAISEFNQRATGLEGRVADNKNNIDSLKITADGLRNQVGTLVPKSDLDNTNKRINDLSTLITQTKNSVDIKANRTDVDRLKQSVTEYNAKLSVQADQITNLVTKSELTTATNGMATQNWVQTQVKQKADQWNLNITDLQTKLDKIPTGGVNLIVNSGADWKKVAGNSYMADYYHSFACQPGEQYVASVEFRNFNRGNGTDWGIQVWTGHENGGRMSPHIVSNYTKNQSGTVQLAFTVPANTYYIEITLCFSNGNQTGASIEYRHLMVNKGTAPAPWAPAPSDMATVKSVTDLTVSVDGIKGTVQNAASKSEVTQLANALQQKVSSDQFESRISQLDNDWNVRVTDKTSGKNLMSQINLTAGRALFQSNKIVLDGDTIIPGKAFIDSAMIASLAADKIYFPNPKGTPTYMSAQVGALDPNAPAGTLSTRFSTGYEVTSSDRGAFLMLNQKELRLAFRARSDVSNNFYGLAATNDQAYLIAEGGGLFVKAEGENKSKVILSQASGAGIMISDNYTYNTTQNGKTYNQAIIEMGRINNLWGTKYGSTGAAYMEHGWEKLRVNIYGWLNVDGYVESMGTTQHSTLSTKINVTPMDTKEAYDMVNRTNLTWFDYKNELNQGVSHRHAGPIIDDVNEVSQYITPKEFIAPTNTARDDGNMLGVLMGAVQYLSKKVEKLENGQ